MGLRTWLFGLSINASHREKKSEIDRLVKDISRYEAIVRTRIKDKRKNVKKGLIKKKLRRKFGGRIKKLNLVLERQGIVGSEMGKQLGNDYARKIVRLREIL